MYKCAARALARKIWRHRSSSQNRPHNIYANNHPRINHLQSIAYRALVTSSLTRRSEQTAATDEPESYSVSSLFEDEDEPLYSPDDDLHSFPQDGQVASPEPVRIAEAEANASSREAPGPFSTSNLEDSVSPQALNGLISQASSAKHGSNHLVSGLLSIHPYPGSATYTAAIRALAIHPSQFLLFDVLRRLRTSWLTLSPTDHYDIAVSLVRNNQIEEALEYVDDLLSGEAEEALSVPSWLWDMLLYALLRRDDLDEALRTLHTRVRTGRAGEIHLSAWYTLFDAACSALHYPGISFVWSRQVRAEFGALTPSIGHCEAVLLCAAREGDSELAQEVISTLAARGVMLEGPWYELLMQSYLVNGKLESAVNVLVAMDKAGCPPRRKSTRPLLQVLIQDEQNVDDAWKELEVMRWGKEVHAFGEAAEEKPFDAARLVPQAAVPTEAIDVVIEACVHFCMVKMGFSSRSSTDALEHDDTADNGTNKSVSEQDSQEAHAWFDRAINCYKQLHQMCPYGPNVDTFNVLLAGSAALPAGKRMAMFLASEMVALKIEPNAVTYDRLISICLKSGLRTDQKRRGAHHTVFVNDQDDVGTNGTKMQDRFPHEDAMRYLKETVNRGWQPRAATYKALIERCCKAGDERAWTLVEKMDEARYDNFGVQSWLEQNWRGTAPEK